MFLGFLSIYSRLSNLLLYDFLYLFDIGFIISSFISYFESSLFFLMSLDKDINFILKKKKAKNAGSCFH